MKVSQSVLKKRIARISSEEDSLLAKAGIVAGVCNSTCCFEASNVYKDTCHYD